MADPSAVLCPAGVINPTTPLAFLPPTLASQFEASRYVYIAALSSFIWDIMLSFPQEWTLLTKYRFSVATFVYFMARISALAYITTSTIFQVGPVGNCQSLQVALGWCFAVAVPSASLLFFFRIRAIFHQHKFIVYVFAFLWIATVAGSCTVPFAIEGGHIGPTNRCVNTGVKPFSSVGVIISGVNDTLIFLAISWRLISVNLVNPTWGGRLKSFVSGNGFTSVSSSLLQGGQMYYLATVGLNIVTIVLILAPSVPAVFHAMLTVPNVALANAMACRVFRHLKLGILRGPESPHSISGSSMHGNPNTSGFALTSRGNYINRQTPQFDVEGGLGVGHGGVHALQAMGGKGQGLAGRVQVKVTRESEAVVDEMGLPVKHMHPLDERESYDY